MLHRKNRNNSENVNYEEETNTARNISSSRGDANDYESITTHPNSTNIKCIEEFASYQYNPETSCHSKSSPIAWTNENNVTTNNEEERYFKKGESIIPTEDRSMKSPSTHANEYKGDTPTVMRSRKRQQYAKQVNYNSTMLTKRFLKEGNMF